MSRFSPAAERNKAPILLQLQRLLGPQARVLEIASGSGQHAEHCAAACSGWTWQPTEHDASALPEIDERCARLANVRPALPLDVTASTWPLGEERFDVLYGANLLHIAPWAVCPALLQGAARHLRPGGLVLLYGPFIVDGVPTASSNETFDADLRARDAAWGLRRVADVEREAASVGLRLRESVPMPANNLLLVFG